MALELEHGADQVSVQPAKQAEDPLEKKLAKKWHRKLKQSEKYFSKYFKTVDDIIKRYRDDRTDLASGIGKRFNMLWANIQTLQPATYSKSAKIYISRRYMDRDPIARVSSQVLERCVSFQMDDEMYHDSALLARDDYLLVARGVHWQRYEADIATIPPDMDPETGQPPVDPMSGEPIPPEQKVKDEYALSDYINVKDFRHDPKATWKEVKWVSKDVLMTKEEATDAGFPQELIDRMLFIHRRMDRDDEANRSKRDKDDADDCAKVTEVWDKTDKQVIWLSPDIGDRVLKVADDFLKLRNFFPCQPPLYATTTTDSLIPRPDYVMYQDQAKEIDNLTQRIDLLTKAIAVRGAYDKSAPALGTLLADTLENKLVGVDNWAAFAEKGGLAGAISFLPIEEVVKVCGELIAKRAQLIQDIYQITGISDIVRGQTQPHETATAQSIKGNFATLRLEDRRAAMQQFIRNGLTIKAEIIAEHFEPETIRRMSGFDMMTEVEQLRTMHGDQAVELLFEEVIKLLRDDKMRMFQLSIETDSTIQMDRDAEQARRTEFLSGISEFMIGMLPLVQQMPMIAPLVMQMLLFGVRGFNVGRELESTIEGLMAQLQGVMQQQQAATPPDPEAEAAAQKAEAETEAVKARTAQEGELHQQEMQHTQQKHQQEMQNSTQKARMQLQQSMMQARQRQMQQAQRPPARGARR